MVNVEVIVGVRVGVAVRVTVGVGVSVGVIVDVEMRVVVLVVVGASVAVNVGVREALGVGVASKARGVLQARPGRKSRLASRKTICIQGGFTGINKVISIILLGCRFSPRIRHPEITLPGGIVEKRRYIRRLRWNIVRAQQKTGQTFQRPK